jgi:hypothetical protein
MIILELWHRDAEGFKNLKLVRREIVLDEASQ